MKEWKNRPTHIKPWEEDQYQNILFVDENNSENLKQVDKKIKNNIPIGVNERFFTVTGIIIQKDSYVLLDKKFEFIKSKYWKKGKFYYQKRKSQCKVCFHSREIRRNLGAFNMEPNLFKKFITDLTNSINDIQFKIITINIDTEKFIQLNLSENRTMYQYAFEKLIQKYHANIKGKGIILLEARGKREDSRLHRYSLELIRGFEDKIMGIYFNSKWNKENTQTYAGLELADLCSYPIHKKIRNGTEDLALNVIKKNIIAYKDERDEINIFP